MFGDSKSPGAVATLESIGNLGADENKVIIQALSTFIEKELGVVPKRSVDITYFYCIMLLRYKIRNMFNL